MGRTERNESPGVAGGGAMIAAITELEMQARIMRAFASVYRRDNRGGHRTGDIAWLEQRAEACERAIEELRGTGGPRP